MKKILFFAAAIAATMFVSCDNKTSEASCSDTDTVVVDSVDTIAVDSVAADTLVCQD